VDIQIRPATADDLPAIARVDTISFGFSYSEEDLADLARRRIRFLVAVDRDTVVGVIGDFRFDLTVPGGARIAVPGVTWVSVLPTHRRRGVLSAMMAQLHADHLHAGDPAAVLTASESGIYGRFGYGIASQSWKLSVDRRAGVLRERVDTDDVEFLTPQGARVRLPELHRQWESVQPGALSRDDSWWDYLFLDRQSHRDGLGELLYLVHPGGYVAYRSEEKWVDGHAANRCVITDYKIATRQAHAAIWQVLLAMDLYASIESWEMPVDDPLPLLLSDPRQVRVSAGRDGLWLRPIDIPTLLAARRYAVDVEAVLQVQGECFALSGGPDHARCSPSGRSPDLVLDLPALGASYLGGRRLNTLAAAGLVRCPDPALLHRLDLAFGTGRAPAFGTNF
jgi:predicted acetyltransferase